MWKLKSMCATNIQLVAGLDVAFIPDIKKPGFVPGVPSVIKPYALISEFMTVTKVV